MRLVTYLAPGFPVSLFERIADVLDAELVVEEGQSGPDLDANPLSDGGADLVWVCSTSFVELAGAGQGALVGVSWAPNDPAAGGRALYFSDIVVPTDSTVQSLDDLAGGRIGCNDPVSLSGFHALRIELMRRAHDPAGFADLRLTGGHQRSLDLLVGGQLDAAVVDSIVLAARATRDSAVRRLDTVQRLGPWPAQPLVARTSMSAEQRGEISGALLRANDDPATRDALHEAALASFVAVDDAHYRPVAQAMSG